MELNFKQIPFLKVILPYVTGVIWIMNFGLFRHLHLWLLVSFLVLVITFIVQQFYKPVLYAKKGLYIVAVQVFLFLVPQETVYLYSDTYRPDHYTSYVTGQQQAIVGVVSDVPVMHDKFTKLYMRLQCINVKGQWKSTQGNTIVYVKRAAQAFSVGQTVLVNAKLTSIDEPKNPGEFNYKRFLERRNIYRVVYADSGRYYRIQPVSNTINVNEFGAGVKERVVSILRESGLSQQAFSVCAALLVGFDDEIDQEVMQSFSHSGTLHVLSVSGMHTAVLYAILMFIFNLFDKHNRYKLTRCVFILVCLAGFVFITGFSPAVLRAAVMLALVLLGKTFYRQGNAYNTLLLSAFVILVYNPFLIADAGFLLSYCAVLGIMFLYPFISERLYFKNKVLQWLWSSTVMSFSATVFTLPITLYFFHQFPLWFILSNLVIIPLSLLLMISTIVLLVFSKIVIIKQFLVVCMNAINAVMLWFAQLTDNPRYGYLDHIHFDAIDLVLCCCVIILLILVLVNRQYKTLIATGVIMAAWLMYSVFGVFENQKQRELLVFHVNGKSCFMLRDGLTIYARMDTIKNVSRYTDPYLLTVSGANLTSLASGCTSLNGTVILHADGRSNYPDSILPAYIVVSHNAGVNDLLLNTKIKPIVIADCSNSRTFVKTLRARCREAGIAFYSVKESGAYRSELP